MGNSVFPREIEAVCETHNLKLHSLNNTLLDYIAIMGLLTLLRKACLLNFHRPSHRCSTISQLFHFHAVVNQSKCLILDF